MANCATWLKSHHGTATDVGEILAVADKALAIDPDLADAYAARGAAMWIDDRRSEAVSAFKQALTLEGNNYDAHFYFARFLSTIGDFEQATDHYMRATKIQPNDCQAPLKLAETYVALGRLGKVYEYAQIGLKRAEEALRQHPENSGPAQLGASMLAYLGENERSREWLKLAMEIDPDDNHMRYNAACTYTQLGEIVRAFDLLEIWVENAGNNLRIWFRNDPDLEPIRNHPRYQKLLERAEA
jgi:adenylate cyclase